MIEFLKPLGGFLVRKETERCCLVTLGVTAWLFDGRRSLQVVLILKPLGGFKAPEIEVFVSCELEKRKPCACLPESFI